MNFWAIINLGSAVFGGLSSAMAQVSSGQPVSVPPVRTYIDGKHVELDITVKPL